MQNSAEDFWSRVNTLIKSSKTTQQSVALESGISYQTFRGWVTRKVFPDAMQAFSIAQVLNTSVEYLITGKVPSLDPQELQELKTKYEALAMTIKGIASTL